MKKFLPFLIVITFFMFLASCNEEGTVTTDTVAYQAVEPTYPNGTDLNVGGDGSTDGSSTGGDTGGTTGGTTGGSTGGGTGGSAPTGTPEVATTGTVNNVVFASGYSVP